MLYPGVKVRVCISVSITRVIKVLITLITFIEI